jgi:hypothetical protein
VLYRPSRWAGAKPPVSLLALADEVSNRARTLLHCMSPQFAHRVESLRCEGSDAIGAKRTCRERRERVDLTKTTLSGHRLVPDAISLTYLLLTTAVTITAVTVATVSFQILAGWHGRSHMAR